MDPVARLDVEYGDRSETGLHNHAFAVRQITHFSHKLSGSQCAGQFARLQIPETDESVSAPHCQELPVGRKHGALVNIRQLKTPHLFQCFGIEDFRHRSGAEMVLDRNPPAIRTEIDTPDAANRLKCRKTTPASSHLPDPGFTLLKFLPSPHASQGFVELQDCGPVVQHKESFGDRFRKRMRLLQQLAGPRAPHFHLHAVDCGGKQTFTVFSHIHDRFE